MGVYLLASTTTRKRLVPTPQHDKCQSCNHASQDNRYGLFCEPCHRYLVEMAFQKLPPWPIPLCVEPSIPQSQCLTCDIHWPLDWLFRDSRGIRKCVICRRWELMHGVEMHPGVPIHITLGPERGIRCFACGKENQPEQHRLFMGIRKGTRTSLFCWDCRHLESRYAAQGLVNIDE